MLVLSVILEGAAARVLSSRWSRLKPFTAKQETGVIVCGNWESGIRYVLIIAILVLVTITES